MVDHIVSKYNSTVRRTMKMRPIDVTSDSYAECHKDSNEKDPKFKVSGCVKTKKTFLLKVIHKIGQKKVLSLPKLKTQLRGIMLLAI